MIARIHDSAHRKIIIKWIADLFPWCAAADVHVPSQLQPGTPGARCLFDAGLLLGQSNQHQGTQPSAARIHQRHTQARCAMAIETPLATSMFVRLRSCSCTQLAGSELRSAMSSAVDMRGPAIEMRCFYGRARGALWAVHAQLILVLATAKLNN